MCLETKSSERFPTAGQLSSILTRGVPHGVPRCYELCELLGAADTLLTTYPHGFPYLVKWACHVGAGSGKSADFGLRDPQGKREAAGLFRHRGLLARQSLNSGSSRGSDERNVAQVTSECRARTC